MNVALFLEARRAELARFATVLEKATASSSSSPGGEGARLQRRLYRRPSSTVTVSEALLAAATNTVRRRQQAAQLVTRVGPVAGAAAGKTTTTAAKGPSQHRLNKSAKNVTTRSAASRDGQAERRAVQLLTWRRDQLRAALKRRRATGLGRSARRRSWVLRRARRDVTFRKAGKLHVWRSSTARDGARGDLAHLRLVQPSFAYLRSRFHYSSEKPLILLRGDAALSPRIRNRSRAAPPVSVVTSLPIRATMKRLHRAYRRTVRGPGTVFDATLHWVSLWVSSDSTQGLSAVLDALRNGLCSSDTEDAPFALPPQVWATSGLPAMSSPSSSRRDDVDAAAFVAWLRVGGCDDHDDGQNKERVVPILVVPPSSFADRGGNDDDDGGGDGLLVICQTGDAAARDLQHALYRHALLASTGPASSFPPIGFRNVTPWVSAFEVCTAASSGGGAHVQQSGRAVVGKGLEHVVLHRFGGPVSSLKGVEPRVALHLVLPAPTTCRSVDRRRGSAPEEAGPGAIATPSGRGRTGWGRWTERTRRLVYQAGRSVYRSLVFGGQQLLPVGLEERDEIREQLLQAPRSLWGNPSATDALLQRPPSAAGTREAAAAEVWGANGRVRTTGTLAVLRRRGSALSESVPRGSAAGHRFYSWLLGREVVTVPAGATLGDEGAPGSDEGVESLAAVPLPAAVHKWRGCLLPW